MKLIFSLIIISIFVTSCNKIDDKQIVETEETEESFDTLSEFIFRMDLPIYVLISEKYGFKDFRLIKAMKDYKKDEFLFFDDLVDYNQDIIESSLLDSMIIKFRILSLKYNISPDTLASALLDLQFAEECNYEYLNQDYLDQDYYE